MFWRKSIKISNDNYLNFMQFVKKLTILYPDWTDINTDTLGKIAVRAGFEFDYHYIHIAVPYNKDGYKYKIILNIGLNTRFEKVYSINRSEKYISENQVIPLLNELKQVINDNYGIIEKTEAEKRHLKELEGIKQKEDLRIIEKIKNWKY